MESKKALTVIGIIVVLLLAVPAVADRTLLEKNSISYDLSAEIVKRKQNISVGVDAGNNMNFGKVPKQNNITKFINISAKTGYKIEIETEGNISEQLRYRDELLKDGGASKIPVELIGNRIGNYTGSMKLTITTPKNMPGERWLKIRERLF